MIDWEKVAKKRQEKINYLNQQRKNHVKNTCWIVTDVLNIDRHRYGSITVDDFIKRRNEIVSEIERRLLDY